MIQQHRLENGVRVVFEQIDTVRSCGIGLWLNVGSRHEQPDEAGLTHFVEHMLFKGTARHPTEALADRMDYLGGNVNAFTTQENLCLHGRCVDRKASQMLDLFSEMLTQSTFPMAEIQRERRVVIEEYTLYEDTPDEFVFDLFLENLYSGHPLGRPVMGRKGLIRRFSRRRMLEYWHRVLHPEHLIVAMAGAFDAAECLHMITERFGSLTGKRPRLKRRAPHRDLPLPRRSLRQRSVEQAHFCLGFQAPHRRSPDRFTFALLNLVLGGGVSSRLFREIRERRGLAYSIGSFTQPFSDHGFIAVSGGTDPARLDEVLRLTSREITRLRRDPIPQQELQVALEQAVDAILMGLENTEARMMRLIESIITFGRVTSIDHLIKRLRAVQPLHLTRVAQRYLRPESMAFSSIVPSSTAPNRRRLFQSIRL